MLSVLPGEPPPGERPQDTGLDRAKTRWRQLPGPRSHPRAARLALHDGELEHFADPAGLSRRASGRMLGCSLRSGVRSATRRRSALIVGIAAVLAVVLPVPAGATPGVHGSGVYCARYDAYELRDCGPSHRLPAGALGGQLGWVLEQLGGGAADLTVEEVSSHFTDGFKALFPAEAVLETLQATLAEHGPARLVGYSYPPRTDQVLAVGETASGERLVVGLGISAGLIELLDVMGAPRRWCHAGRTTAGTTWRPAAVPALQRATAARPWCSTTG